LTGRNEVETVAPRREGGEESSIAVLRKRRPYNCWLIKQALRDRRHVQNDCIL